MIELGPGEMPVIGMVIVNGVETKVQEGRTTVGWVLIGVCGWEELSEEMVIIGLGSVGTSEDNTIGNRTRNGGDKSGTSECRECQITVGLSSEGGRASSAAVGTAAGSGGRLMEQTTRARNNMINIEDMTSVMGSAKNENEGLYDS